MVRGAGKKKCRTNAGPRVSNKMVRPGSTPCENKKADHKKTQVEGARALPVSTMATLMQDLPRELHLAIMRYTPHPCAALMRDVYRTGRWRLMESRRRIAVGDLCSNQWRLEEDRHRASKHDDPVAALAADRYAALKWLTVYSDADTRSLWAYRCYRCPRCRRTGW